MKSLLLKSAAVLACLAAGCPALNATSLRRADVSADAVWLLHVDCDALRPTAVGQYILSEMDKPEAQARLAAFQAIFNFDLRKQLHGLTLYGTGTSPEEGVLILYADFDAERLVVLAKSAQEYKSSEYKKHLIHSWMDDKKKNREGTRSRVYAAVMSNRVIFGQTEKQVFRALDVLDGAVSNLASSKTFSVLGAPTDTSIIEGAARKFDVDSAEPSAALFRLSKLAWLQLGQSGGKVTGTLTLEAADAEIAGSMTAMGQGLVALLKLQKEKPESVKLASALAVRQEGPNIVVSLSMPTNEVVDLMKADAARRAKAEKQ